MKCLFVLILVVCTLVGFAQTTKQAETPVQILYGQRTADQNRQGPLIAGVLNMKLLNDVVPLYP